MRYSPITVLTISLLSTLFFVDHSSAETVKLHVPYTSQAPDKIWRQPWQDACEEASILMVDAYYRRQLVKTIKPALAKQSIKNIIALEDKTLQHNKDTGATETALIINNFFTWEAAEKNDPTLDDIRAQIDLAQPVIAPVYGKGLQNPNFRAGGPDYHMVVITGYDDATEEFIVNEPGINYGLDFRYSYATIMDVIHDFVAQSKTQTGRKVVLFTNSAITWDSPSAGTDGDNDGANKADEISYGSSLQHPDTDRDGFSDGFEITRSYSPTTNERTLPNKSLIKLVDVTTVYYYHDGVKQPILNEEVFKNRGWKFADVKIVGEVFLSALTEGELIE